MRTHILLFIEGETEEVLFPAIIQYYRSNYNCQEVEFHYKNLRGIGNYKSKAKGILQETINKVKRGNGILKVVICSYDSDVFDYSHNPPIDWKLLKKKLEDITKAKNIVLMPSIQSIEDWLLSDMEGLCNYLKAKKPRNLPGKNGHEKIKHLFKLYNKVYYKGYDSENIVARLDIGKIVKAHEAELNPIREALGIK